MEVRSLGFQTDLMVRSAGGSEIVDRGDHLVVRTPRHPDFHWGNFLLVASPFAAGDGARWRAAFSAEFPGARHLTIGVDGTDGDVGEVDEVRALGMEIDVSTVLTASALRAPARLRRDAVCQPLAGDDDWRQAVELRLAVASDEGHESGEYREFLAGRVDEARRMVEAGRAEYFGAFVDGRLLSFLGLVANRGGLARFQTVETHPDHRRRGLAGALLHAAGSDGLGRLGATTLVIVADPDGPAVSLYRSLGFVDTERQVELSRRPPDV